MTHAGSTVSQIRDTGRQSHIPGQGCTQVPSCQCWMVIHAGSITLALGRPACASSGVCLQAGQCNRPAQTSARVTSTLCSLRACLLTATSSSGRQALLSCSMQACSVLLLSALCRPAYRHGAGRPCSLLSVDLLVVYAIHGLSHCSAVPSYPSVYAASS